MIDLDKYMNASVEVKLFGKKIHILQPSAADTKRISNLESGEGGLTLDERLEMAEIILNHNKEEISFTREEIETIPYRVQSILIQKIVEMNMEAESDPN